MPGGPFLSFIFFGAFLMAAFSSLLPMMQLLIRNLTDYSISRKMPPSFVGLAVLFSVFLRPFLLIFLVIKTGFGELDYWSVVFSFHFW
jgi:NSS family neurotransmitter:Na+ symporter